MHFLEGDIVCGVDVVLAKQIVKFVDSHQWCSVGATATDLGLPRELVEPLIRRLHDDGYLDSPHHGPLPDGHVGKWLATEGADGDSLLLWHVTSLGKALAKAPIGPSLTRGDANGLLEEVLGRCDTINCNPRASHWIESVTLYGSMCDPLATEFGDVDIAVVARRRRGRPNDDAWSRIALERFLRANNERVDVVVTDESWHEGSVIPDGAIVREVYPRTFHI